MTEALDPMQAMIDGLRDGSPEAFRAFMMRYRPALERIAARRIEPALERRVTAESVAHSVCRTFIRRASEGRFELVDGDALWRLLCAMTLNKVRDRRRHHRRQKRDLARESDLADVPASSLRASEPGPAEIAAFEEALEQQLAALDDEERLVFDLRLRGLPQVTIAEQVGCSERTVRRILARLESRLREGLA